MDTCSIGSFLRAHAALYILLAIAGIQHIADASATRRLRGPNICYHYDIGRYCCPGFEEVNGFCLLKRKTDTKQVMTTPRTSPFVRGSRIRFAPKPDTPRLVSLTKVDKDGRPLDVAYSHGRRETVQPDKGTVNSYKVETAVEQKGFYIPFDMEAIRRNLRLRASATTPTPATYPPIRHSRTRFSATSAPTRHGRIRFAPSPKPYRPWDDKEDRIRHHYNQVAVGKAKDGFFQAVLTDQVTDQQSPYEGQGQGDSTGYNTEEGTEGTAQVRQREIVVYNGTKDIPTTEKPEGRNDENRIYFQPEPIISEQQPPQWQGQQQGQDRQRPGMQGQNGVSEPSQEPETGYIIKFKSCPEGYTAVFSPEEGEFCYPTSALTPGAQAREDRAPLRGDGALRCPPGHDFRSSQFGDACVPYDWQPCSGEPGCDHSNEKLRVDPVFVTSDCQMSSGVATPCRNTGGGNGADVPPQELQPSGGCTEMSGCGGPGCADGGCDDSNNDITNFPASDCGPQGCEDCVDGACGGIPNSGGCSGAECPDYPISAGGPNSGGCSGAECPNYPVSAGSGRCMNGGTSLNNGFCACRPGYYGSQCEHDLDECMDRSPCSHECLNTIGSYKCFCPAGSILAPDGVSCILITCPKCLHGGYCDYETNKCVCTAGFTGAICEIDIDECSVLGTCSQGCRNTFGSYACLCRQGYTLLRDGHTCEDYRCRPSCVNGGVCFKNRCLCPAGYSGIICQFNNRL